MKTVRIFLSVVALVLGFAGAAISRTSPDITDHGIRQNQPSQEFSTVEKGVCDNNLTDGSQCTLDVASNNAAYKITAPSQPLVRQ